MSEDRLTGRRIGWIGAGRMGFAMARRLLAAGCRVAVYNRTRAKAEPLAAHGADVVDSPAALADRDIVFTMLAGPDDFKRVVAGAGGLLSNEAAAPAILVDCTSVDEAASAEVRQAAARRGARLLAAPVSGNARVVEAGRLTIAASGPSDAFDEALPLLEVLAPGGVTHVGEGDAARVVKICHNVLLGVVAQTLAEITVLAERNGVPRADFLDFINNSVMGSAFTRYKTPAYVNLDFTPTFTPPLLCKDMDLGLASARARGVPMPVAAAAREIVQAVVGRGHTDCDFAVLLRHAAESAGLDLEPEDAAMDDGLGPP